MARRRIYIDFDDVLCETARELAKLNQSMHGRQVAYEDIHAFDLGESFSLSEEQLQALMHRAHEEPFLRGLCCTDGAVDGVRELVAAGFDLVIVTGRPAHCHRASLAWLVRHGFPELPVLYVDKYGRDHFHTDPSAPRTLTVEELLAEPFFLAVDDSPMALELLHGQVPYPLIVFDRPWNRDYRLGRDHKAGVMRASDWRDLCRCIAELC